MKRAKSFAFHLQSLQAFDHCDPEFAKALDLFSKSLTPSHSLTSRRYSVWSAVRSFLDEIFVCVVESYSGVWQAELLDRVKLSEMCKSPPVWRADPKIFESPSGYCRAELNVFKVDKLEVKAADTLSINWQVSNLELWDANLRYAIRSAQEAASDSNESSCNRFCGTLDTVRGLFDFLAALRPGRTMHYGNWLSDSRTRPQATSYCALCWRTTKRWAAFTDAEDGAGRYSPDARWRKLSNRYCEIHDPSDPDSMYHCDLPYKPAFLRELEALMQRGRSEFLFRFPLPNGADIQELRKTAYDQVHAGLRPATTSLSVTPGLRERVWVLHREGLRQAEIARRLGVSRQAVSKAWKSLKELVSQRQAEVYINPVTGEPDIAPSVLADLASLHAQGVPIAEIARRTRLLKRTVEVLIYRAG
ncbi:hypothetical protein [Zestomonas carbonaria]|uniref:Uncharacterized protein n=1 Tax=Zestomonas carbonaria TaxID=2762745 RepID=A0A7U7EQZ0_9GAMM|nr:hypothetical protein [Pseudomonas carbonaria]CAD5108545.1 hypothetical protein PSEWESI4_02833 [Pseudomonas carbonaria]